MKNTAQQITDAYNLWKGKKQFPYIAKKSGILPGSIYYVVNQIRKHLRDEGINIHAKEYAEAYTMITGKEPLSLAEDSERLDRKSLPKAKQEEITTELLIKIYELKQSNSSRSVSEQLGWHVAGSTKRVDRLLDTLGIYLAPNLYDEIRNKNRMFKKAREKILSKYPNQERRGYYLIHEEDGLYIAPGVDWESKFTPFPEPEPPTPQEKLNDSFKELRKSIKDFVVAEVAKQTLPEKPLADEIQEALTKQEKKKQQVNYFPDTTFPKEIDDDGVKGYFLEDIEAFLDRETFQKKFLPYQSTKEGGVLDNKYYVLKKDFDQFLLDK